jgi:hypothetical protein
VPLAKSEAWRSESLTALVAFAVALFVSDTVAGIEGVEDAVAEARAEKAIDDGGVTVELAGEASQSPKPDRQPSPQKSGPEPQYSYWLQQEPPATLESLQVYPMRPPQVPSGDGLPTVS